MSTQHAKNEHHKRSIREDLLHFILMETAFVSCSFKWTNFFSEMKKKGNYVPFKPRVQTNAHVKCYHMCISITKTRSIHITKKKIVKYRIMH